MKKNLFFVGLLAGMFLAGCTTTSQGERRLNLSPLLFYSADTEADRSQLEILGPLFSHQRAGATSLYTLAPLFYYLTEDGAVIVEFLYPFGQYKYADGDARFNIIPMSSYRSEEMSAGASNWQFFPFYGGRTAGGERYGGVFPFYGTYKERFNRDRGVFFLWPLYSSSVTGDTRRYSFLWPIFTYASGGEEAFAIWPFGGKIVKPGVHEKYYALWPFISYQRLNLDTDNPRTVNAVLPFYAWDTSADTSRKSILFPFFTHTRQEKGNYDQWDTPWPLIVRGDGDNYHLRNYFPFYYNREEQDKSRFAILWWLYDRRTDNTGDSKEESTRYLFFSHHVMETTAQGDWQEKNRIWPLYYETARRDLSHAHAPEIIFIQSPGFDRLFGPYVYLWSRDRYGSYRQGKALWGLYRWQENQDYRLWELSFLASRETTADTSKFRLLSGLLTWEREGAYRRLKLLYLPHGFSW